MHAESAQCRGRTGPDRTSARRCSEAYGRGPLQPDRSEAVVVCVAIGGQNCLWVSAANQLLSMPPRGACGVFRAEQITEEVGVREVAGCLLTQVANRVRGSDGPGRRCTIEKVLGVGGVFLRARDHVALAQWYGEHLGLDIDDSWWGAILPLTTEHDPAGAQVVWSAFKQDTDYFASLQQQVMINYRVRDCHAMVAQLRAAGCDVAEKVEESEFGIFGWVTDPEGNKVELWQPPASLPCT